MKKTFFLLSTALILGRINPLSAHCQMPCGIYHDDMVYDQIDQYVETMYKGITILNNSKFNTVGDRNEFVRWVGLKEKSSDEVANLLCTYFMQQKIKPDEADTVKRLTSAHHMLFLLMKIKQNVDRDLINAFADEWEKFKLMFHVEGYECQIEILKIRKREEAEKKAAQAAGKPVATSSPSNHDHDHDHDHDHEHEHDHSH